jgi:hypothetical protein
MDFIVIILGIIVLVLVYYLYVKYVTSASSLVEKVDLKQGSKTIDEIDISNPGASNYSYSTWVYVNTWNNTSKKSLIKRAPADADGFELYLDQTTPTLKVDIKTGTNTKETVTVTNNFPIQRWTYVCISLDSGVVDAYLDGKLVTSKKLSGVPASPSGSIVLGGGGPDIQLARVRRDTSPLDPTTAWNNYLQGNGISGSSKYAVNLSVLKDNVEQKKFNLF